MQKDIEQQKLGLVLSNRRINSSKNKRMKFLKSIDNIIDWQRISEILEAHYKKGKKRVGRKSYPPIVLFKMLLLQYWYGLSDYDVEEECRDSLAFSAFIKVQLEDDVPDHSVISRFRSALSKSNCMELLLKEINTQIEEKGVKISHGKIHIVDASITESSRKPKGKKEYAITEAECIDKDAEQKGLLESKDNASDKEVNKGINGSTTADKDEGEKSRENTKESHKEKEYDKRGISLSDRYLRGVDTEAGWYKKGNKFGYGYKKHVVTNDIGIIEGIHTTPANEHDSIHFKNVLDKVNIPRGSRVLADKGYSSSTNRNYLKDRGLKSGIMYKEGKDERINNRTKRYNKKLSKIRYVIERSFGSIKLWFNSRVCRYVGLIKTHVQHLLEAIAYNLYRLPNIKLNG